MTELRIPLNIPDVEIVSQASNSKGKRLAEAVVESRKDWGQSDAHHFGNDGHHFVRTSTETRQSQRLPEP
jgi:hypothetical protein